jgi:hypothetical protein
MPDEAKRLAIQILSEADEACGDAWADLRALEKKFWDVRSLVRGTFRDPDTGEPVELASPDPHTFVQLTLESGLQRRLRSRTDAYIQALYSSLSHLAKFVQTYASHDFRHGLRTGVSIQDWLSKIAERLPHRAGDCRLLTDACKYRARFIDHPQSNQSGSVGTWDWVSIECNHPISGFTVALVWVLTGMGASDHREVSSGNPYAEGWHPPGEWLDFGVAPSYLDLAEAYARLALDLYEECDAGFGS